MTETNTTPETTTDDTPRVDVFDLGNLGVTVIGAVPASLRGLLEAIGAAPRPQANDTPTGRLNELFESSQRPLKALRTLAAFYEGKGDTDKYRALSSWLDAWRDHVVLPMSEALDKVSGFPEEDPRMRAFVDAAIDAVTPYVRALKEVHDVVTDRHVAAMLTVPIDDVLWTSMHTPPLDPTTYDVSTSPPVPPAGAEHSVDDSSSTE